MKTREDIIGWLSSIMTGTTTHRDEMPYVKAAIYELENYAKEMQAAEQRGYDLAMQGKKLSQP